MEKKKVLVLSPYIPTLGGGEKHMGTMCQFIERYYNDNVHIDILVHDYNDIHVDDPNYTTIEDINHQFGLDLKCTNIKKVQLPKEYGFIQRAKNRVYLSNCGKDYDIFINFKFNSFEFGTAKTNLYACMFPQQRLTLRAPLWRKWYAAMRDKRFYDSYDAFIANSYYTYGWLERYWGKHPKNKMIYPPVFSRADIDQRYREEKKENIIVSVGRFFVGGHCKRQVDMARFFLNHMDELGDFQYHLIGAVSNYPDDLRYLNKVKRLARISGGRIVVHENASYDELIDLYQKAKVFWHAAGYGSDDTRQPENMEHFGITTVEAMSYGAVPVVIKRGGQTETVNDNVDGFHWETESECIEKTVKLIRDDAMRKDMAQRASKRADDYSVETFFKKNEELFHELHI